MIENERLAKIMEILEKEQFCTTESLAERLFVVSTTIRRDFKKLEQQGLISRCYGGASIIPHANRDVPFTVREHANNQVKASLAREALKLIEKGSTIFLDASSTASYIANLITPEHDVTVITSGIKAAAILSQNNVRAYCTGGQLVNGSLALTGSFALNMISSLHADLMFFSAQGIDTNGNISDSSDLQTQLRQLMIQRADESYFVCDSSKIGKKFLFSVCNVQDISGIICDVDFPIGEHF